MNIHVAIIIVTIIRGLIAAGLIGGGLYCLYSASRWVLGKRGPSNEPTRFSGKIAGLEFKIASGTIATLVLCISAIWAVLGYLTAPNFRQVAESHGGQHIDVTSTAPFSVETTIPLAENLSAHGQKFLTDLMVNGGANRVSSATIAVPSSVGGPFVGERVDSIRQGLISAGVDPSKVTVVQTLMSLGLPARTPRFGSTSYMRTKATRKKQTRRT